MSASTCAGAGVAFKEKRVNSEQARLPQRNRRGESAVTIRPVKLCQHGAGLLQIPEYRCADAGNNRSPRHWTAFCQPCSRRAPHPAHGRVGIRGGGGAGDRIPCEEIRPDDHQLTPAEILAVGFHPRNGFASPCADITRKRAA